MARDFTKLKLKNGIEILLVPRKESPATTVMVTVKVGSKYETKNTSGLSHFLEHMAFKGTEKRPGPIDVALELEGLGASYNAMTSHERTLYYAKVRNAHFDRALDVISDLYLNPTIPEEELEKERGVIIEEINMIEDTPMRNIFDVFMHLLYGDQPAGWPVIGRKEVIKNVKREEFIKFRTKHYVTENTIVTIAGGYKKSGLKSKLEKIFGAANVGAETKMPGVKETQSVPQELIKFKKLDQAHIILGFRAFDIHDKRRFALELLAEVLGGGMSSRLFEEVREKRGLAYYVGADAEFFTNSGFIAASAGVNKDKTEEAIKAILNEFQKIKEKPVGDKELKKAKEHFIGPLFISLENSTTLAMYYTGQRVMGLTPLTPKERAAKTITVTAKEIMEVANEVFQNKNLNLAVIGPFKNKSFGDILKV